MVLSYMVGLHGKSPQELSSSMKVSQEKFQWHYSVATTMSSNSVQYEEVSRQLY
jgi:hypothetical protein